MDTKIIQIDYNNNDNKYNIIILLATITITCIKILNKYIE
jgi:hypothetical protein